LGNQKFWRGSLCALLMIKAQNQRLFGFKPFILAKTSDWTL